MEFRLAEYAQQDQSDPLAQVSVREGSTLCNIRERSKSAEVPSIVVLSAAKDLGYSALYKWELERICSLRNPYEMCLTYVGHRGPFYIGVDCPRRRKRYTPSK